MIIKYAFYPSGYTRSINLTENFDESLTFEDHVKNFADNLIVHNKVSVYVVDLDAIVHSETMTVHIHLEDGKKEEKFSDFVKLKNKLKSIEGNVIKRKKEENKEKQTPKPKNEIKENKDTNSNMKTNINESTKKINDTIKNDNIQKTKPTEPKQETSETTYKFPEITGPLKEPILGTIQYKNVIIEDNKDKIKDFDQNSNNDQIFDTVFDLDEFKGVTSNGNKPNNNIDNNSD